ncbi:MAG: efflux RND transporter periplasmic adaptor subunit [Bacillota bacterium]|nr:efflux RND transporter periplasmic adaptor subunit [Bacillota bacterium]
MSQRLIAIIVIVVIVVGGGLYAYKQLVPADAKQTQGPVYATKEVIRGDITVGVTATGMLNPTRGGGIIIPGERGYDSAPISYILDEILVEAGDAVEQGQVIARVKSYDLETQIKQKEERLESKLKELTDMTGVSANSINTINPSEGVVIRAPQDGRIIGLDIKEGDELQLGQTIARIADISRFRLRAMLYPLEYEKVSKGQKVLLRTPYFEQLVEAYITELSDKPVPVKDSSGFALTSVYWMTIEGDNPGFIQPGMEVRVGLPVDDGIYGMSYFANKSTIERYIDETKIVNRAKGIVTDIYVYDMEEVKKGDKILSMSGTEVQETLQTLIDEVRDLQFEVNNLRTQLDRLDITASMTGVVASIYTNSGETVRAGQWIGDIYNTSSMMLWTQVDDIDIIHVKMDAPVRVTVDALPGEVFEGKVTYVSPMGEKINGITKFSVNMEIKGGPQLRPGMQANAYIDAGSAENVLLVPVEAIFEEDGKPMVEVLDKDGSVRLVEIKLGLMNDRYAEVISGLEEGELVITGSSADLLPSQHIKSDTLLPDKKDEDDNNNENSNGQN